MSKTPTVLVTDIGSDIDDTWALVHLLRSPELDLKMILTETGEARYRGAVCGKMLEIANRTDVDIALGKDFGVMEDKYRHQGPWVDGYELDNYPGIVHQNGVQAFIDLVQQSPTVVNVIAIGPPPSLAQALTLSPDIAKKCRLFGMFGSFDMGYDGSPTAEPETNVRIDPQAFRIVAGAAWHSAQITPLDTCGTVKLDGERFHSVWCSTSDPLLRALIENNCIWAPRVDWMKVDYFTQGTSVLFDDVAVYMAYAEQMSTHWLEFEQLSFSVTDDGCTVRDDNGPFTMQVAMHWKDKSAFLDHLTDRLRGQHLFSNEQSANEKSLDLA